MTPDGPLTAIGYIPLRARDGSVRAWAMVDADALEEINALRWYLGERGYPMRQIRQPGRNSTWAELMHRRILGLERGDPRQSDHINRDKLDNRRANLRIVTPAQNNQNVTGGHGLSGVHGVHWEKSRGKWLARGVLGGRLVFLGRFDSIEEAGAVAAAWRAENVPYSPEVSI